MKTRKPTLVDQVITLEREREQATRAIDYACEAIHSIETARTRASYVDPPHCMREAQDDWLEAVRSIRKGLERLATRRAELGQKIEVLAKRTRSS